MALKARRWLCDNEGRSGLAETSGLELSPNQTDVLAEMNEFAMAGRYPDTTSPVPARDEAKAQQAKAQEVFQWLIGQL